MATGWAGDTAVQDQIEDNVKDALAAGRKPEDLLAKPDARCLVAGSRPRDSTRPRIRCERSDR